MSRSARALRGVIASASLLTLLGLLVIAMPLISVNKTRAEFYADVAIGAIFVVLGAYDLIAAARNNFETMVWRSVGPAVVGLALALSPLAIGYSSRAYEAATVVAGLAAIALSLTGGWLSSTIPLPMPRFRRPHA